MKFHLNGQSWGFLSQNGYTNEVSRLKKVSGPPELLYKSGLV